MEGVNAGSSWITHELYESTFAIVRRPSRWSIESC